MLNEMLDLFFYFMNERHAIYIRRFVEKKPWPWTDDPLLQEFKYTNVYRELDVGTIWLRENWREPFADHRRLFFNIALYRQFNYWPTAEFLGYVTHGPYDEIPISEPQRPLHVRRRVWYPVAIEMDLHDRAKQGHQIFTGAHMITGTYGGREKKDKIWQVIWPVLNHLWENEEKYTPQPGDTLEQAFNRLEKSPGFGPFLAYEVITDLRHTRYLQDATDIMTWANPGPGAMRGINRLLGYPVGQMTTSERYKTGRKSKHWPVKIFSKEVYIQHMQHLLGLAQGLAGEHVHEWGPLEMRDIEHSLCEWDKYMRVKLGQGRPRSRFVPPHLRQV